jgi:dTDP-4-amino-4,6-dideoxygalactose transaminase
MNPTGTATERGARAATIPISVVDLPPETEALVLQVLRSGVLAQGPMVARLEDAFARRCGVAHAVAVSSGTTALVAAFQALGIGPGDEVVTTPFTFVATVNAALEAGATVVLADVEPAAFALDPDAAAAAVGPRTAAVAPVHLYGQCADVPAFAALADRHGLALVEDAAQALGAAVGPAMAGSTGVGTFSLYATKNVTTAEGGVVTTQDAAVADRLRILRNQGMRARYEYEVPGHNYRLTDLQAAVGLPQMDRLDDIVTARRANAAALTAGLAGLERCTTPVELPGRSHVWHQYTVTLADDVDRDGFVSRMAERGVTCGVYYPRLVSDYDCYREHPRVVGDPTPVAASLARRVVSLPVHPRLGFADVERIVDAVGAALDRS